jgi:hypothetical protein
MKHNWHSPFYSAITPASRPSAPIGPTSLPEADIPLACDVYQNQTWPHYSSCDMQLASRLFGNLAKYSTLAAHYSMPSTPAPRGTAIPRTLSPVVNRKGPSAPPEPAEEIVNALADGVLAPGWTCSTHVFQAGTPRESPPPEVSNLRLSPTRQSTKLERQALADVNFQRIMELRSAIALGSQIFSNDTVMWNAANRYAPDKPRMFNTPAITLVVSHAVGFHKEVGGN